jgi:hypothetical protein
VVSIDDLGSTTSLAVATDGNADGTYETSWTIGTDFVLYPQRAAALARPWTSIVAVGSKRFPDASSTSARQLIQVTGLWGWPSVPHAVRNAALQLALNLFKRHDAPGGVVANDFGAFRVPRLDPDVAALVRPLRRVAFA